MTPASLQWMEDATALLLRRIDHLADDELKAPTALDGWTRRHLLAHVGFNAQALSRLAAWARTGVQTPMYDSAEQRASEIEDGAEWEPARLRRFVADTARTLAADLAALPDDAWQREVVTAQGRTVPATEIPWMRTREVAVHAVDLAVGVAFDDLPDDVCVALVADVAALRSARGDGRALELVSSTGGRWRVPGQGEPVRVHGPVWTSRGGSPAVVSAISPTTAVGRCRRSAGGSDGKRAT
jgi:maleylpyruvate isomerase